MDRIIVETLDFLDDDYYPDDQKVIKTELVGGEVTNQPIS